MQLGTYQNNLLIWLNSHINSILLEIYRTLKYKYSINTLQNILLKSIDYKMESFQLYFN